MEVTEVQGPSRRSEVRLCIRKTFKNKIQQTNHICSVFLRALSVSCLSTVPLFHMRGTGWPRTFNLETQCFPQLGSEEASDGSSRGSRTWWAFWRESPQGNRGLEPPLQPWPRGGAHSWTQNEQRPSSLRTHFWHYNVSQGNMWPQTGFISCSLDRKPLSLSSLIYIMSRKMSHTELSFVKKYWQEVPNWDWSWFLKREWTLTRSLVY